VDSAWRSASASKWLARQKRVDGVVPLNELAAALMDRATRGELRLEGPALAAVHAQVCHGLKVFHEERP
jgi:hypothetical protein